MKRSEAEQIINNWLDTADEITGKTVIDFLQGLGMQPPQMEEQIIYDNEEYISFKYEWEKE